MAGTTANIVIPAINQAILDAAQSVAQATSTARYASPPVSNKAFDCSYFVWLVVKTINPLFSREPSAQIANDRLNFRPVAGLPLPGDIVYFPPATVAYEVGRGDQRVYPGHVAIMMSTVMFIGMQTGGVGPQAVMLSNVWWGSRPRQYFRYIGPAPAVR